MISRISRLLGIAAVLAVNAIAAPVLPRDGDYLSTVYIAALEKTRSHCKALMVDGWPVITASREKSGHVRFLLGNWHEGTWAAFDPQNPSVNLDREGGVDAPFVWIDKTHFRLGSGKDQRTFQFVGKAETYIGRKLLAGSYRDQSGRPYTFSPDGTAQFPDRVFHYEIYGDMVFEGSDEFTDLDATKPNALVNIGFEWKGRSLHLYELNCPETSAGCGPMTTKPIAVLRKVGG